MLSYNLEERGAQNLYEALYSAMRSDIACGKLAAGEHLPSKRDFARTLGVSVITVEHAYRQLVAEGYVRSEQRRGYFVNDLGPLHSSPGNARQAARATTETPVKATETPAAFDFTGASIQPGSFPFRAWQAAMREVMCTQSDQALLASAPAAGLPALRSAIAKHVRQSRGIDVSADRVVVGAGAQILYSLIVQLIGQGGRVAVEDPGYPRLSKIYQAASVNTCFIGVDEHGANVQELEYSGANIVHVMPSHHFPTGVVMPVSRRYELLSWASESWDRYIAEDDYDCEFRHVGKPIPALQGIDVSEKVIYLNTFTKTLGPGMRISYMILPPHLMDRFNRELGFYSCSVSNIDQLTLAAFMESGQFDRHVNRMRRLYRASRDAAIDVLGSHGLERIIEGQDAGLHFLLNLPDKKGLAAEIADQLRQEDVAIRPLNWYCSSRQSTKEALIVNYASLSPEQAAEGMNIVAKAIAKHFA